MDEYLTQLFKSNWLTSDCICHTRSDNCRRLPITLIICLLGCKTGHTYLTYVCHPSMHPLNPE